MKQNHCQNKKSSKQSDVTKYQVAWLHNKNGVILTLLYVGDKSIMAKLTADAIRTSDHPHVHIQADLD